MEKGKLLIIAAIKSLSWARKFGYKKPIQNHNSKIGVFLKNIGSKPIKKSTLKNALIHKVGVPLENAGGIVFSKEFNVKELNPGEDILIWFENAIIPFSGQGFFDLEVENQEEIELYQWDEGNKLPQKISNSEKWISYIIVQDENILQQKITNYFMAILTILILFITIYPK